VPHKAIKSKIRSEKLQHRLDQDEKVLRKINQDLEKLLLSMPEIIEHKNIMLYYPTKNEVNTLKIISDLLPTKNIYLPKIKGSEIAIRQIKNLEELSKGKYEIMEPSSNSPSLEPKHLDIAIIPGVAFDIRGMRLGYGKGYYDRLIKNLHCPKIALAYEFQIVDNIPEEEHDHLMNKIVTEKRIITI